MDNLEISPLVVPFVAVPDLRTTPKTTPVVPFNQPGKSKSAWWIGPNWLALLGSLGMAALYGRVALLNLTRGLVGGDTDGYENLWNNYWVHTALFDLNRSPFFTDYLYYPTGISLRFHTLNPLNGLLFWPLWPLLGSIAATNLQFLLSMALTTFCGYLFFKDFTGSSLAAFAGSAVFTFGNDQLLGFYSFGQAEKLAQWWLPLYLWCLFRALPGPQLRPLWWLYLLASVGTLVAMSLTDWQLLMYAVLLSLGYGIYSLFRSARWVILGRLCVVGLGWLALVIFPLLLPMLAEANQNSWLSVSDQAVSHSRTLSQFIEVGSANPGYLVLGIIIAAFCLKLQPAGGWRNLRLPKASTLGLKGTANSFQPVFWLLAGLVAAVLSLGPRLIISDTNPQPTGISLPYAWLYKLPVLSTGRDPERFYLIVMLVVGLFLSLALPEILGRLGGRWWQLAPAVLTGLVLTITLSGYIAEVGQARVDPPNWPPFYSILAQDKEAYSILELPLFTELGRGEDTYEAYQSIHGKARFGGRLARDHKLSNPNNFAKQMTLFRDFYWLTRPNTALELVRPSKAQDIVSAPDYRQWSIPLLNFYNVRYIILYLDAFRPAGPKTLASAQALVRQALGTNVQPVYQDNNMLAYQVPADATAPTELFLDVGSNGWYPPENGSSGPAFRWANLQDYQAAEIIAFNATRSNQLAQVQFNAFSFQQTTSVSVWLNDRPSSTFQLQPAQSQLITLNLTLPPGQHLLKFSTDKLSRPTGNTADNRLLSFGITQLHLLP